MPGLFILSGAAGAVEGRPPKDEGGKSAPKDEALI